MQIKIAEGAAELLAALEQAGYQGYVVGGCVRDSLLGIKPQDWDICTSARPEQVLDCLQGYTLTQEGLRHGTVTAHLPEGAYEITSFRRDGDYQDFRRPRQVEFVASLEEDLARRDFTINALAYHPRQGLVDYHGGVADIAARRICSVGQGDSRFQEDALRIMRGLRFAATLDFSIEENTAAALRRNGPLLAHIAAERLRDELEKLLLGPAAAKVLADFPEIIAVFIPEMAILPGFQQHNPYHHLDIWQHTLLALSLAPAQLTVALALFFHDIGKPSCFQLSEDGYAHYYGHAKAGAQLTREIMNRLRFPKAQIERVGELVLYHDGELVPQERIARHWLHKLGEEQLRYLLELKRADALAHRPASQCIKLRNLADFSACLERVLAEQQCCSLAQLALNGGDILALGIPPGPEVGRILGELLALVIEGQAPNQREALAELALGMIQKNSGGL